MREIRNEFFIYESYIKDINTSYFIMFKFKQWNEENKTENIMTLTNVIV